MKAKKIFLLFTVLFTCFSAKSHSPTEIGFRFIEEDNNTYLEVHLTSITLFDLLYSLHPELKSKESLNLSHYTKEYETYFNQIIDLSLNDEDQSLTHVKSNLVIHDASIQFLIQDFEGEINEYSMAINGFDFYQKPSYTVLFTTADITEAYFLSKEENTCSGVSSTVQPLENEDDFTTLGALLIISCLLFSGWRIRKVVLQ